MIAIFLMGAVLFSNTSARANDLMVPWPFPWAKECPVEWKEFSGRYILQDMNGGMMTSDQFIELAVSVEYRNGIRLARVAQFDIFGEVVSAGITVVNDSERALRLRLIPVDPSKPFMDAEIRLYYTSNERLCTMDHLVPILNLTSEAMPPGGENFKLVKLSSFVPWWP
jgi:hypothetical protein